MTEEKVALPRTDLDILEDIHQLIRSYQPLTVSRGFFRYSVQSGVVTVEGHIKSSLSREIFTHKIPLIEGVDAVDVSRLYDDETLRLSLGKLLPMGVRVRIEHGAVALTGRPAADLNVDELVGQIGEVAGVREVTVNFS